jgi:hypothetical protein
VFLTVSPWIYGSYMSMIKTTGNVQSMKHRTGTRSILEACIDRNEHNTVSLVNHNMKAYSTISFATHIRYIFTAITSEYGHPLIYLYYSIRQKEVTKICMFLLLNWFLVHFTFMDTCCIASHDSTPTGQVSHYFNINTIATQLNMVNSPVVQEDLKILTPGW